ncbi:hypothetical protein BZA70DRAFT_143250 [Myxozyma melibiosi]|uniref:K Homology domain-containing protein n=1 Tax=Myxozyma melibiosi TaxID=54550 RepID=A0ABR1F7M8_9ASCO
MSESTNLSPADLLREKREAAAAAAASLASPAPPASVTEPTAVAAVAEDGSQLSVADDEGPADLTSSMTTADTAASSPPASASSSAAPSIVASAGASPAKQTKKKATKEKLDISSLEAFPTLGGLSTKAAGGPASVWGAPGAKSATATKKEVARAPLAARSSDVVEIFTVNIPAQSRSRSIFTEIVAKAKSIKGVTSIESSTSGLNGSTTFIIKGKSASIPEARRELIRGLTPKVTETIAVPNSVRPYIIGTGGRTLKGIQQRTTTKVQVQKKDDGEYVKPEFADEEESTDVTIEGDIDGVALAKAEILAIVNERTKNLAVRLKTISADYFPFFATKVSELEDGKDVKVKVPAAFSSGDSLSSFIVLSGDREAVEETKNKMELMAQELKSTYVQASTSVPPNRKQFVDGAKNKQEIFEKTGCLIKIGSSDVIDILGPRESIGDAISLVAEKANSFAVDSLIISKAHGKNLPHAISLSKYFEATKKLGAIEAENSVQIKLSPGVSEEVKYEISSRSEPEIKKARKSIIDLVNSIPPLRVRTWASSDPLLHRFIARSADKHAKKVREQYGVVAIIPAVTGDILLVYEGKEDDEFGPEENEVKSSLEGASAYFDGLKTAFSGVASKTLKIPAKQHKFIIGPKRSTINALTGSDSAIEILLGVSDDYPGSTEDSVIIIGPSSEIDSVASKIKEIVEEASTQEILSSFTVTFPFPQKFSSQLIGRGGSNISKYRDELGVKIDVDDSGNVSIKGIKNNVLEAQSRMLALAKRLEDEVVLRLAVPNEHHSALIGQKGKFVRRIEDRYEVRVNFPRASDSSEPRDKEPSEFMPKSKDEIVIRGPSKGAAKAREELLELYKYEAENGFTETMSVPRKALARVIGRGGEQINEIMDETKTKIDINQEGSDVENVKITGTEKGVKSAKTQIEQIVSDVESSTSETLEVPKKFHRDLIGPKGATLTDIVATATGDVKNAKNQQQGRIIRIPPASSPDTKIVVSGHKDVVAKVIAEIKRRVEDFKDRVEEVIEVEQDKHRFLIGREGAIKKSIESENGVELWVPPQGTTKEVKIVGKKEAVEKAKAKIVELTTKKTNGRKSKSATPQAEEKPVEA